MKKFNTGAFRSDDKLKNDYEGFLSPLVIESFGDYMTKHRVMEDGNIRDSDNWQLGVPITSYMKSAWRHFLDLWKIHRGHEVNKEGHVWDMEECANALLFNVMGILHELLKNKYESNRITKKTLRTGIKQINK